MIIAVDVHYRKNHGVACGILFQHWRTDSGTAHYCMRTNSVQPYRPGYLYARELPCLMALLNSIQDRFQTIVIDGYVWLDDGGRPGLGAHLHRSMGEKIPVIGVAKSAFKDANGVVAVNRGKSRSPLYITAAGMDRELAARRIREMHGSYRIPTLLKRVDRLCKARAAEDL